MVKIVNLAAVWFLRRRYGKGVVCAAGLDTEIEMLEISGTLSDSPRLFCSATNTYFAEMEIQRMNYSNHPEKIEDLGCFVAFINRIYFLNLIALIAESDKSEIIFTTLPDQDLWWLNPCGWVRR